MRGKKCWKRVTAVLMAFMMLVGLVMTNGITSEAYWYNSEGERYPNVGYRTHVQSKGWERKLTLNGRTSGTVGAGKRLEAIQIIVEPGYGVGVEYRTHIQSKGWEKTWKKDGETSGTSGEAKRLEAINIVIVPKGANPGVATSKTFVSAYPGSINYKTHVQTFGWENNWRADGTMSGTSGKAKRLEAIQIRLGRNINGGVRYKTHVQTFGWQNWVSNGTTSGTSGLGKRLEAIQIELTGQAAQQYDIYYRVHVQSYGWLDWAKNGQMSGTSGLAKRLEGIQIVLVPKGAAAPGKTARACINR